MAEMADQATAKLKESASPASAADEVVARTETPASTAIARLKTFGEFWVFVWESFVRNRCPLRAAGLAYTTLLALIPMIAVAISVSSSLLKNEGEAGIEKLIDKMVANVIPETTHAESLKGDARSIAQRTEIARHINDFVQRIQSGTLGTTGMIVLIFMGIMMLARVEDTFNDIWGVAQGRTWFSRVLYYWGALTLGPMLIAVALALTGGTHMETTRLFIESLPYVGEIIFSTLIKLLPFIILSISFTFFYMLMPNAPVNWRAALVGGIVGGGLWQLNTLVSVFYVSRVVTNSKIYGSLGMVPLFMVGLYFSWTILLFGAQVAYSFQNRRSYFQERQVENVSQRGREFVALRVMSLLAETFALGQQPPDMNEIAEKLGVPSRLVGQVLGGLTKAELVVEVSRGGSAYAPARPLDQITVQQILEALRSVGGNEVETKPGEWRELVRSHYENVRQAERSVAGNITLQAIVDQRHGKRATLDS